MRFSTLFGRTLREAPSDADLASHQLLVRSGMIRPMAAGIYSYLPLGLRVVQRIAAIIRAELDAIGGQELLMPIAQPAELWQATGRYQASAPGPALVRWLDRNAREMVLAMTHEEAVTALARSEIRSHRQLPLLVYQIQTKFRDEPRPRGGLIRTREFLMQDGYSFHADAASLDATYHQVYAAYLRIMARCGLDVLPVVAATGMMGGARSHEFVFPSDVGEDTVLHCPRCGYAANAEAAQVAKGRHDDSPPGPIERVATPDTTTIEALARLLGIAARQTLKAVLFSTPAGEIILAVIRGDLAINEAKLSSLLGDQALAPATAAQLEASGLVAGYASPVGLHGVRVVADDSVGLGGSFVAGANEAGYHLRNVSYPRDFAVERMADLALARAGDPCPHCGATLAARRGIELGHIFQLGTHYSEALGATFLDGAGSAHPLWMGCYGIGLGRLMGCIVEQHHDGQGIVWPASVAPVDVHLVSLGGKDAAVDTAAEALYARLGAAGWQVLHDDRPERAGVKFNDADLIGAPVRLTVSARTVAEGQVEAKRRCESDRSMVPLGELEAWLADALGRTPA